MDRKDMSHEELCDFIMKELQDKVKPVGYFTPDPVQQEDMPKSMSLMEVMDAMGYFEPKCDRKPSVKLPFDISVGCGDPLLTVNPDSYFDRLKYRLLCYRLKTEGLTIRDTPVSVHGLFGFAWAAMTGKA